MRAAHGGLRRRGAEEKEEEEEEEEEEEKAEEEELEEEEEEEEEEEQEEEESRWMEDLLHRRLPSRQEHASCRSSIEGRWRFGRIDVWHRCASAVLPKLLRLFWRAEGRDAWSEIGGRRHGGRYREA